MSTEGARIEVLKKEEVTDLGDQARSLAGRWQAPEATGAHHFPVFHHWGSNWPLQPQSLGRPCQAPSGEPLYGPTVHNTQNLSANQPYPSLKPLSAPTQTGNLLGWSGHNGLARFRRAALWNAPDRLHRSETFTFDLPQSCSPQSSDASCHLLLWQMLTRPRHVFVQVWVTGWLLRLSSVDPVFVGTIPNNCRTHQLLKASCTTTTA